MVLLSFPSLYQFSFCLRVNSRVKNRTDVLEVGVPVPEFSLRAANRETSFTLTGLLKQGKLILEFLRGTW